MKLSPKEKYSLTGKRIYVAGHNGMVGSALIRALKNIDCLILTENSSNLDLKDDRQVNIWFNDNKPDAVFMAAAKVGGILANNNNPVNFLEENLAIQNSVISASYRNKVEKFMFLGSSCIYPRDADQPLKESSLLTGALEPTNEAYAIAKIAGIKLCQFYRKQYGVDYISVMPTNLYGPNDNFHPQNSHVVAALISKFYDSVKKGTENISLWGTGSPLREFMFVDDLADGLIFIMKNYSELEHINIGTGKEISIKDFAELIKEISGWKGEIEFDKFYPDGMPRKIMDINKISDLGWKAKKDLKEGLKEAYDWYVKNYNNVRVK